MLKHTPRVLSALAAAAAAAMAAGPAMAAEPPRLAASSSTTRSPTGPRITGTTASGVTLLARSLVGVVGTEGLAGPAAVDQTRGSEYL